MPDQTEFIAGAGASLVSKHVLSGEGQLQWAERKPSKDPVDNGWRFISAIDTEAYLSDGANWQIVDFNELCEIEPAVIAIWDQPVGSELQLIREPNGMLWIDDITGIPLPSGPVERTAP